MYLDVEIVGGSAERVASRFLALERRLDEPRPVLEDQVAGYLRTTERSVFATRRGGRWPENRPSTIRKKGHGRVLYDTGRLERSLTRRTVDSVQRVAGDTLTFGTSLFYGRFVIKRRWFFSATRADARQIGKRVSDWLLEPFDA